MADSKWSRPSSISRQLPLSSLQSTHHHAYYLTILSILSDFLSYHAFYLVILLISSYLSSYHTFHHSYHLLFQTRALFIVMSQRFVNAKHTSHFLHIHSQATVQTAPHLPKRSKVDLTLLFNDRKCLTVGQFHNNLYLIPDICCHFTFVDFLSRFLTRMVIFMNAMEYKFPI